MVLRSVASRLALGVLAGSAIVLIVTGGLMLSHTREQMLEQTRHEAAAIAASASARIQGRIDGVARVARVLAGQLGTRREQAATLLRDALAVNPEIVAIGSAFIPRDTGAPKDDDAPVARRSPGGRIAMESHRADPEPYWTAPWFVRGLNCDTGCWQPPFRTATRPDTQVGYTIAIPGRSVPVQGVVEATISLEWLQALLGSLDKPAHASAFVLDSDGEFLAHDWLSYVGTRGSRPLLSAVAQGRTPVRITPQEGGRVSEPVWVYFVPIRGTRWTIGLTMPEREVLADLRRTYLVDLVLGMLENKDADAMIARFASIARSLAAVPVPGHPHHPLADLARRARAAGLASSEATDLPAALAGIRPETGPPPVVLILGSLYLAGTALAANDELPD